MRASIDPKPPRLFQELLFSENGYPSSIYYATLSHEETSFHACTISGFADVSAIFRPLSCFSSHTDRLLARRIGADEFTACTRSSGPITP
jgi:hypothetical protein